MARPKNGEFFEKQMQTLTFLHSFISEFGHSPLPSDFEDGIGKNLDSMASHLRMLQMKGALYCESRYLCAKNALAVFWVMHPALGYVEIDNLKLDPSAKSFDPFSPFSILDGERKERKCMCCQNKFMSEHKFNRLCPPCSSYAAEVLNEESGLGYVSNGLAIMQGHMGGFRKSSGQ